MTWLDRGSCGVWWYADNLPVPKPTPKNKQSHDTTTDESSFVLENFKAATYLSSIYPSDQRHLVQHALFTNRFDLSGHSVELSTKNLDLNGSETKGKNSTRGRDRLRPRVSANSYLNQIGDTTYQNQIHPFIHIRSNKNASIRLSTADPG